MFAFIKVYSIFTIESISLSYEFIAVNSNESFETECSLISIYFIFVTYEL